ncbi:MULTISPECIES: large conductance mechanosensitive channel protein MscL [Micromonospora]|uniref:Large-conductance mechanosensitive channel n=1 Tax=Micromonospora solifontis TaxID=2487138 RepID=A0ABX9WCM5_9ACTN|nr:MULTISPECIES: large conductance mechanosensitive channel protein MscL [Micromonospora]NES15777.1 large conductance mechanosensitive channel protein MscL [Micromonospora sp. PPF5-17B]NES38217.1 large conductance mechanosensitive channel protein MscL [Micromonospora solifontis]NES56623.1 large conductance mechanosensitive channel protein MscL [Micromonospora sp. PPF5-6]RNL96405.1 large conductance mechanosensitive channel protein MscL [Micromonospora solifontis]
MLKGFKDFIMRGNVVDLAVGIVIGAAFTGLVSQFTKSFLEPLIKFFGGGTALTAGRWKISSGNYMDWAAFINAAITFLLTAAVLYFLVVYPMNRLAERRKRGEEPPPAAPSEEVKLLTEIRDALLAGHQATPAQRGALDDVLGRRPEPPAPR